MASFTAVLVTDAECESFDIPSISEYLKATNTYGISLLCVGGLAVFLVIFMFIDTLRYVMHHASSPVKTSTAFILAVYPVLCLVSYCALLVPRAFLISEALTQGIVMVAMYQLFCLFLSYSGGDDELIKIVSSTRLNIQVAPCCCWPCCSCLPSFEINKKTLKYLKLLVLQLPLVQGLVYFIFLVMWAEAESLYQINYLYLQPIIMISILFGVWGMLMTINLLKEALSSQFLLLKKFGVLQLVLVLAKVQGIVTRMLIYLNVLPCTPPLTPQVYATLIHNSLMIVEMVILGFFARNLYKRSTPDIKNYVSKNIGIISTLGSINVKHINNNGTSDNHMKATKVYVNTVSATTP